MHLSLLTIGLVLVLVSILAASSLSLLINYNKLKVHSVAVIVRTHDAIVAANESAGKPYAHNVVLDYLREQKVTIETFNGQTPYEAVQEE